MKTLQVLEPEKLTPEEVKALQKIGFDVYSVKIDLSDPVYLPRVTLPILPNWVNHDA